MTLESCYDISVLYKLDHSRQASLYDHKLRLKIHTLRKFRVRTTLAYLVTIENCFFKFGTVVLRLLDHSV